MALDVGLMGILVVVALGVLLLGGLAAAVNYLLGRAPAPHDKEGGEPGGGPSTVLLACALGGAFLVLLLVCGGAVAFFGWTAPVFEAESAAPPVVDEAPGPVTRQRLVDARLVNGGPAGIVWDFTAERFTLTVRGGMALEELFHELLGPGKKAERIAGRWALSKDGCFLELSDITGDGRPGQQQATLPIASAGQSHVMLGERQYNVLPGAARPAGKKD
jgi:hypothetical protein